MNQSYTRLNAPHTTLSRNVFGVQLYKMNARVLLSRILSTVDSDCLQHARSVRGVYVCVLCAKVVTIVYNIFISVPLEWIAIWVPAPGMLLVSDLRQGALYAMMFSFWIIFIGEHLMVNRGVLQRVEDSKSADRGVHIIFIIIS